MEICCINPPIQDFYCTSLRRQPIGLLYIIAALEQAGHSVILLNGHTPKKHHLPLPGEFEYLKPFIDSQDSGSRFPFKYYTHYGASFQEIQRGIKSCGAKIFFISCLFTTYYAETAEIISIIKKIKKDPVIVVGGYHAALYPEYYLLACGADYVITGEGESASVELLDHLQGKIDIAEVPSLCYLDEDSTCRSTDKFDSDIDSITFPARDHLLKRDFSFYGKKGISMVASRGCPNRCDFCTSRELWSGKYRMRSISSIIEEIDLCIRRYDATLINFEDDNLMGSSGHTRELLNDLIAYQKHSGITLDLTAMNGLSLEQIDEETINLMHCSGFRELNISLVSRSSSILKNHGRPFDSRRVRDIALSAQSLGMRVRAYFILGLPDQTREEIEDTIHFLHDSNTLIFPSVFYDVKTPEAEWKKQRSSAFYNETQHLSRQDLIRYFNLALRMNNRSFTN